jgi:radical SAM superfamily enzyme YgiQ (UPF0313 family)
MRILLLMPDGSIHRVAIGSFRKSMREAPLTLTALAALIPPELDAEVRVVDGSVQQIPMDDPADVVGISAITGTALRAYKLADHYRARGATVVLGGVHPTLLPEEAAQHSDAVVIGPAERTWPQLLRDHASGGLQRQYRDTEDAIGDVAVRPRRDLQSDLRYALPQTVSATRGCRHCCEFCTIPQVLPGYHTRAVGDVIDEIAQLPGKTFAFNDVSLVDDVDWAKELFKAMIPLRRRWGGLATVRVADDPELLDLIARSGCRYLLIGFESVNRHALGSIRKGFNRPDHYRDVLARLHERDISVQGCFVFGFDGDTAGVFANTVDLINQIGIDIPRYAVMTPYPGTELFSRFEIDDRIITRDWSLYDTMHVVFQPVGMSLGELENGFAWAWRETFRLPFIVRRIRAWHRFTTIVNLAGNWNYRRFARRLARDPSYRSFCRPARDIAIDPRGDLPCHV